ncbi:MAG: ArsR family transcriptional regulator [Streptosporangiales bacterium]|nr:ArsR family transcriptional regulator [Streptosporangiales bacterium]
MIDSDAARAAVEVISGKWVLVVLVELAKGPKRHNELARETGLEQKPLDRALRRLEEAGLVARNVSTTESPPRVRYRLTSQAEELLGPLGELAGWWHREMAGRLDTRT